MRWRSKDGLSMATGRHWQQLIPAGELKQDKTRLWPGAKRGIGGMLAAANDLALKIKATEPAAVAAGKETA